MIERRPHIENKENIEKKSFRLKIREKIEKIRNNIKEIKKNNAKKKLRENLREIYSNKKANNEMYMWESKLEKYLDQLFGDKKISDFHFEFDLKNDFYHFRSLLENLARIKKSKFNIRDYDEEYNEVFNNKPNYYKIKNFIKKYITLFIRM